MRAKTLNNFHQPSPTKKSDQFETTSTDKIDYIAQNFYNPLNIKIANGKASETRRNLSSHLNKGDQNHPNFMTVMNIDESSEFESVIYKPRYF